MISQGVLGNLGWAPVEVLLGHGCWRHARDARTGATALDVAVQVLQRRGSRVDAQVERPSANFRQRTVTYFKIEAVGSKV